MTPAPRDPSASTARRLRPRAPALRLLVALLHVALAADAEEPAPREADAARAEAPESQVTGRIRSAYAEYRERVDAGQLADALGPAKRAYDYAQQDLAVEDPWLANTAAALGRLLLDLDRPLDALRPLTHARELYDLQRGPSSAPARAMQLKVAQANEKLNRAETTELAYLALIDRARGADDDTTAEIAGAYARLQTLMLEAEAWPRARRYGLQAMRHYERARGKESMQVGLVVVKLARGALEAGDYGEGLDFLDYGVPILEKTIDRGDPRLTRLYEFLVEVYAAAGDVSRERRYRIRLKKNRARERKTAEAAS